MCEYCGCQALASIDDLTREHDLVVRLISDVRIARTAGDVARMANLARQITTVLDPHTRVEEHGLFPAMKADFPDQIAALEAEHASIHAVLSEASDGTPRDPGWPERLCETLGELRQHILREQDGVFPAALATLVTADWELIEDVRAQAGSALDVVSTHA
jgi:hypothetical protein